MCGIAGIFCRHGSPGSLDPALDALHHRGPDARGSWCDRGVALGHTRLKIVGLENGRQPIVSEDGRSAVVVNGEFYGHSKIRRELERQGHRFATDSDSEIALHLYEAYGAGCLEKLRGEFAFAVWDGTKKQLFAARDRFGIKPLCYAYRDGILYLASEAKAILALGFPARWNHEAWALAAHFQYTPPGDTLFEGIHQVPPGHYLLVDGEGPRLHRYWDLDLPAESEIPREAEWSDAFLEKLEESVRLRLQGEVPVCCHLSGGIDSSSVAALAAEQRPGLPCFSVVFDHPPYDEREIAEETAAHIGATWHPVPVSQPELIEHLPDAVFHAEGLAINGHLSAKYLLNRAIHAAGFKVALTGEGADEVLGGYVHFRQDLLAGDDEALARLAAKNQISKGIMLGEAAGSEALSVFEQELGYVPAFLRAKAALGGRLHAALGLSMNGAAHKFLAAFSEPKQLAGRHPVHQSMYLWSKSALATYILRTLGDGMEMSHSVEGRLPFLDHELFALLRTVPLDWKIRGTCEKYLLKEAMKSRLTPRVYQRQKQPFLAPPLSLFHEGESRELLLDTLHGRDAEDLPFFDAARVRALADRADNDPVLFLVLSTVLMQQRFGMSA